MNDELNALRNEINQIDEGLLQLLHQRQQVVNKIGKYKQTHGIPARDAKREAQLLKQLKQLAKEQNFLLSEEDLEVIFGAIIQRALNFQAFNGCENSA